MKTTSVIQLTQEILDKCQDVDLWFEPAIVNMWYHRDITGTTYYGPYPTEKDALKALIAHEEYENQKH